MMTYKQISYKERVSIETLLNEKRSNRYIASFLRRSPNTIGLEIERGGGRKRYKADRAEELKVSARKQSKHDALKVCVTMMQDFVRKKLKKHWSPERISGFLKRDGVNISTKAIYQYVYEYNLEKYLFWHIHQKKKESISSTSFVKDDRKYIEERPMVNTRGHYEMDFIVSGKTKTCLLVIVDKVTRKVSITKLKDRKKRTICRVVKKKTYNPQSITIDNDIVFQQWKYLETILHTKIYFTHPYHAYEKGLIENTNRWIRVFFPKHINFDNVSFQKISSVEKYLNTIPRKVLDFKSANEVEEEYKCPSSKVN